MGVLLLIQQSRDRMSPSCYAIMRSLCSSSFFFPGAPPNRDQYLCIPPSIGIDISIQSNCITLYSIRGVFRCQVAATRISRMLQHSLRQALYATCTADRQEPSPEMTLGYCTSHKISIWTAFISYLILLHSKFFIGARDFMDDAKFQFSI